MAVVLAAEGWPARPGPVVNHATSGHVLRGELLNILFCGRVAVDTAFVQDAG
jgi:hypothetical protein